MCDLINNYNHIMIKFIKLSLSIRLNIKLKGNLLYRISSLIFKAYTHVHSYLTCQLSAFHPP